jgi:GNAT superfamily N-acetyltransferase
VRIVALPVTHPDAGRLVEEVQQEYVARYGGPDESPVDPAEFAPPHGRFFVGYLGSRPVATGGIRRLAEGVVEIKRMFVIEQCRGRGLARVVLGRLEDAARELAATRIVLETGLRQPEAMALYESAGYERIPGFGHYACQPMSVSYAKSLRRYGAEEPC